MKTLRTCFIAIAIACISTSLARAQEEDPAALAGTWKRDGDTPRLIRIDYDAQAGELVGKMLNPPEDPDTHKAYGVDVRLKLTGKKLEGRATWSEENGKKGQAGQPDVFMADARWELNVEGPDKLVGRCEAFDFDADTGAVSNKDWEPHTFTREKAAAVTHAPAPAAPGPDKVEAGQPIDAGGLAGTWKTPSGSIFTWKPADAGWSLERVKGEGDFPASIRFANEGNVLKGVAKWEGGFETAIELKLAAPGRLEGRTESAEGDKGAEKKVWVAWTLERLPRIDGSADAAAVEPGPLAAGASGTLTVLDLKRDDGLYLKLTAKDGGGYEGELVSKTDGVRAKVELAPGADTKLVGKATFKVDGNPVEARWELAPAADGTVEARCEWLDWDAANKTAVARGFVARKFKPLRKVG